MVNSVSPFVMIIFGATGDLTSRKLIPALYQLFSQGFLPKDFLIMGVARREFSDADFRNLMRQAIEKNESPRGREDESKKEEFLKNIFYTQGMFEETEVYESITEKLKAFDEKMGACITRFFYLATPPQNYPMILSQLAISKLSEGCGQGSNKWTRVLIEKPFGKDLDTAKKLEDQLCRIFDERQIYRIDHYLAKETLQNILFFRFANGIFEPLWNNRHIDHVQISLLEASGIGTRAKFYEGVGAMRDSAQNHLMAMLAYVSMEEPVSLTADAIRQRRQEILSRIKILSKDEIHTHVVRGQYKEYKEEKGVDPKSQTETFAAFKLFLNDKRWSGVPFYLRTGKKAKRNEARIDIFFKNPTNDFYKTMGFDSQKFANSLTIWVQPREGISVRFYAKKPGLTREITPVDMDFSYERAFNKHIDDSYEKLLLDSMRADQTLFATSSGFSSTWKFVTPILKYWEMDMAPIPLYKSGDNGPREAVELLSRDGKVWIEH